MTKRKHELAVGLELCSKINHIHQLKDSNMSASMLWLIFHHLLAVLPDKDPSYSLPTAPQSSWWMDCHKMNINTTGNDFTCIVSFNQIHAHHCQTLFRKCCKGPFTTIFNKSLLCPCVNARGIPTAAYQVLHVPSCPGGMPAGGEGYPILPWGTHGLGYPLSDLAGVTPSQTWPGYPQSDQARVLPKQTWLGYPSDLAGVPAPPLDLVRYLPIQGWLGYPHPHLDPPPPGVDRLKILPSPILRMRSVINRHETWRVVCTIGMDTQIYLPLTLCKLRYAWTYL